MTKRKMAASVVAVILTIPGISAAQTWDGFVVPFNEEGHPQTHTDQRVPLNAVGVLQGLRGRAWWHALTFCAGAYSYQAFEADGEAAETLHAQSWDWFYGPAIERLMADRNLAQEDAETILEPDVNFHLIVAAEGGERDRPFSVDVARCEVIRTAHDRLPR